jgi:hypothetical protein
MNDIRSSSLNQAMDMLDLIKGTPFYQPQLAQSRVQSG